MYISKILDHGNSQILNFNCSKLTLQNGTLVDMKLFTKKKVIFINCNLVVTRWQWLFYMYTNMKKK